MEGRPAVALARSAEATQPGQAGAFVLGGLLSRLPNYARFLTRDQLRELPAPSPANVLSAQSWLSSALGATHTVLKDSGDFLEVTMPSLHRLSGDATIRQRFYATAPKIITDLIDDVVVIRSPETSFKRQKLAYGMPANVRGTNKLTVSKFIMQTNSQMVWGPCTYGYLPSDMKLCYSSYNVPASTADIVTKGYQGLPGGDNFGEDTLDVSYISDVWALLIAYSWSLYYILVLLVRANTTTGLSCLRVVQVFEEEFLEELGSKDHPAVAVVYYDLISQKLLKGLLLFSKKLLDQGTASILLLLSGITCDLG
ncbi:subtilisin [Balamuthia mandrillaris]